MAVLTLRPSEPHPFTLSIHYRTPSRTPNISLDLTTCISRRDAQSPKTRPTSVLPPELWLRIFDLVTAVPDSLETDLDDPFDVTLKTSRKDEQKRLRESLVTKCHLVRVCKQWQTLASRFLYRIIVVGRGRTLSSLAVTLSESKEKLEGSKDANPLGWYTQRLDFVTRGQTHSSRDDSLPSMADAARQELEYLAQIIRYMPNLSIFTMQAASKAYPEVMSTSVMRALGESCGPSLRVLNWPDFGSRIGRILDPRPDEWRDLLSSCPNLRVVRCSDARRSLSGSSPYSSDIPSLQDMRLLTLSNKNCEDYLSFTESESDEVDSRWPNRFPSLQHVRYHDCAAYIPRAWKRFLQLHGSTVTSITIIVHYFAADIQGHMDLLSPYPNITHVNLHFGLWPRFRPHLRLPTQITHLGILSYRPHASKAEYRELFESIRTLHRRSEGLQVVRFLDQRNVKDLRERHAAELLWGVIRLSNDRRGRRKGLKVENHEGRVMGVGITTRESDSEDELAVTVPAKL
ncbi:hypothetical protein JAAARDRAFT_631804 [Jaapia argillacea MUCL 33604]|uniref:Uncharacterized protein n=1 Tax=Jaapia argillacea MUCL 33604 TaxID=933084 RepID=A0A067PY62_9AGAM|nr:hypothetical protein JAAARDRAFT_631804 [Jaapia argillacea MUCL 33604]